MEKLINGSMGSEEITIKTEMDCESVEQEFETKSSDLLLVVKAEMDYESMEIIKPEFEIPELNESAEVTNILKMANEQNLLFSESPESNSTYEIPKKLRNSEELILLDDYTCLICSKSFTNNAELQAHLQVCENTVIVTCTQCNKSFTEFDELENHNSKFHLLICEYCAEGYPNLSSLNEHKESEHQIKEPSQCTQCNQSFTRFDDLENHNSKFHLLICEYCAEGYPNLSALTEHKESEHKEPDRQPCNGDSQLEEVTESEHQITEPDCQLCTEEAVSPIAINRCSHCKESFMNLEDLEYHNSQFHILLCEFCAQSHPNLLVLNEHKKSEHGITENKLVYEDKDCDVDVYLETQEDLIQNSRINRQFKCIFCNSEFGDLLELTDHTSQHIKGDTFCCLICEEVAKTAKLLIQHCRSHQRYRCELCGNSYNAKNDVHDHQHSVHGIPKPKSRRIERKDPTLWELEEQSIKWGDWNCIPEKRELCEICGKEQIFSLKLHKERYHQGKNRLQCEKCFKIFKSIWDLKIHKLEQCNLELPSG